MTDRCCVPVASWLAVLLGAIPALAADLSIRGACEQLEAELDLRAVAADIGSTVEVPITVRVRDEAIDAIRLEVDFPATLAYVGIEPGELTATGWSVEALQLAQTNRVQIVAASAGSFLPPGAAGRAAVVVFTVISGGEVGDPGLDGDLPGEVRSPGAAGTIRIPRTEWAFVKALYRDR